MKTIRSVRITLRIVRQIASAAAFAALSINGANSQNTDTRPTFSAPDGGLAFRYPAGWSAQMDGQKVRLTAPDGARYLILRDSISPFPAGDPAISPDLRSRAETAAGLLLSDKAYAGVKPVTLPSGSGAIFRFRGRGSKGTNDLFEIWFAQIGAHNLTIAPDAAPTPDHAFELGAILKTLSFSGVPGDGSAQAKRNGPGNGTGAAGSGQPKRAGGGNVSASSRSAATISGTVGASRVSGGASSGPSLAPASRAAQDSTAPGSAAPRLLERYEGRLLPSDYAFSLKLFHGGAAAADWTRASGPMIHYEGTYTGQDGTYTIKMTQKPAAGSGPAALDLTTRALGGEVSGQYSAGTVAYRSADSLKLMEVDVGDVKFRTGNTGASASTNASNSGTSNRRAANRARNRTRRINPNNVNILRP